MAAIERLRRFSDAQIRETAPPTLSEHVGKGSAADAGSGKSL